MDKTISPECVGPLRSKEQVLKHREHIKEQTTMKRKKDLRTEYGVRDNLNPFMRLSLDLSQ